MMLTKCDHNFAKDSPSDMPVFLRMALYAEPCVWTKEADSNPVFMASLVHGFEHLFHLNCLLL